MVVYLWGCVSVFLSSTSFVCGCLTDFSPFGVASGFLSFSLSLILLPLPSDGFHFCHLVLFSGRSLSLVSFRAVFPLLVSWVSVLCSLVFDLCPCSSSSVLVCLRLFSFLRCFLHCGLYIRPFGSSWFASLWYSSSSPLLSRWYLNSFATGLPFGTSQLLRLVSSPSPDVLVGLCTLLAGPMSVCSFLFLLFSGLLRVRILFLSLVLCFVVVASLGCMRHGSLSCGILSPPLSVLALLLLRAVQVLCVRGGSVWVFLLFPLWVSFLHLNLHLFLPYFVIRLFPSLIFQLWGECL